MAQINGVLQQQLSTSTADIIAQRATKLTKRTAKSAAAQTPPAPVATKKAAKTAPKQQAKTAAATTVPTNPIKVRQVGTMPKIPTDVMEGVAKQRLKYAAMNPPQTGPSKLELWKAAREASGVFARYEEAGNKVGMPVNVRVDYGNPSNSGTIPEEEQRQRYGNYFVYKVEEYADRIMNDLKSIQSAEERIELDKQAMPTSSNPSINQYAIEQQQERIALDEESIAKNLGALEGWSGYYGAADDAKQYMQEYTRDQYGNEQKFETLWAMYGVA